MRAYLGIIKLVCLLILVPIITWNLSIKETFALYKQNKEVEVISDALDRQTVGTQIAIPAIITSEALLSNGKILSIISDSIKSERVEIVKYTPTVIDAENDWELCAGELILSGRYINLVKIISFIENSDLPLKVSSLNFEYDRKKRDPAKYITLTIILHQIEKNS